MISVESDIVTNLIIFQYTFSMKYILTNVIILISCGHIRPYDRLIGLNDFRS